MSAAGTARLKTTAGVLLIIAVILALFDRVAAGSLVAALFVVVALFEFLPQMESFAAFGIKAQWRKKLDEAEEILEKLKQSTKASAQLGYYLLGWGSRMGGQTTGMKRDVAEQIDKALTNLGVDPDTLAISSATTCFSRASTCSRRSTRLRIGISERTTFPQSRHASTCWKQSLSQGALFFGHSVTTAYRRLTFPRRTRQSWEHSRIRWPTSTRSAVEPVGSPMRPSS
jgi:hypothetical protein